MPHVAYWLAVQQVMLFGWFNLLCAAVLIIMAVVVGMIAVQVRGSALPDMTATMVETVCWWVCVVGLGVSGWLVVCGLLWLNEVHWAALQVMRGRVVGW